MSSTLDHVFRFKQPARHSVFPTLFVGVGGAGGQMVERIVEKIGSRWDAEKFRGLYHAFVLDTDTSALNGYRHVPQGNRIFLSDFDKRWFMGGKRGESHVDEDPFVTQWVHPWYGFRAASGDGAGQIRLESRLALHYQLEQDRGDVVQQFEAGIRAAMHHDNPYRCTSPARMNVHIFSSVAGGTGSGIFLSLAYLWRRLLRDVNHEARVFGYLMLPGPFFGAVPHVQEREIDANGYAALKELEHLMSLGVEGKSGRNSVTYHYSGYHRGETEVAEAPFNFVYLLDDPARVAAGSLAEYRDAVADAMFVQFFSPVFGSQQSSWDNMIKLVGSGTSQGYVLNYGAYGANVLILPARDILDYCARRYALDALDRFLLQRGGGEDDAAAFTVRTDTEEWARLGDAKRAQRLDDAFIGLVDHLARREKEAGVDGGVWQAIRDMRSARTGGALREAFLSDLKGLQSSLQGHIGLDRAASRTVAVHDHDVHARRDQLKQDVVRSRNAVGAAWANVRIDLESGAFLRRFFDTHGLNPLAQRYLLIQLGRDLKGELTRLGAELATRHEALDLDAEERIGEFDKHQKALEATAPTTLWERLRKENSDFNASKSSFIDWFNRTLVQGWADTMRLECEHRVLEAVVKRIETLLQTFRDLLGQGQVLRDRLARECEYILSKGGLDLAATESSQFAFDTEVLRDEGAGRRLWDRYYEHAFARNAAYFAPSEILPALNAAFDPERDTYGNLRQPDVETIGRRIVENLRQRGVEKLGPVLLGEESLSGDRSKLGLMVDEGLDLEARFVLGLPTGPLADADGDAVEKYISAKLAHVRRKAAVLCTIQPPAPDPGIHEDDFVMVCGHPAYRDGLLARFAGDGCKVNVAWDDPRTLLVYSARLGMPLYWVRSVNQRMKDAYRDVQTSKVARRAYPLHIDHAWETSLADLDPVERRREAEMAALDEDHIRFAFCRIGGAIVKDDAGWRLSLSSYEKLLASTLPKAMEEFKALRADLAQRLDARMADIRAELESPHEPASAWQDVATYVRQVADDCLSLPQGNVLHEHRRVISAYMRMYAPEEALAGVADVLAPLPDAG